MIRVSKINRSQTFEILLLQLLKMWRAARTEKDQIPVGDWSEPLWEKGRTVQLCAELTINISKLNPKNDTNDTKAAVLLEDVAMFSD